MQKKIRNPDEIYCRMISWRVICNADHSRGRNSEMHNFCPKRTQQCIKAGPEYNIRLSLASSPILPVSLAWRRGKYFWYLKHDAMESTKREFVNIKGSFIQRHNCRIYCLRTAVVKDRAGVQSRPKPSPRPQTLDSKVCGRGLGFGLDCTPALDCSHTAAYSNSLQFYGLHSPYLCNPWVTTHLPTPEGWKDS